MVRAFAAGKVSLAYHIRRVKNHYYHGYSRANSKIYECSAFFSSGLGFSGKRAMVVWNSFQAARPSSALFTIQLICRV